MFGGWLRNNTDSRELSGFYYDRGGPDHEFNEEYRRKRHLLVYGLPRQGKRTLVQRGIGNDRHVVIYGSDDTTFADIFRNYLLTIGCSVTIEQKRRRRLGGKAEIKFPWPVGPTIGGSTDYENEITQRSFSADIGAPNDVCYLIREIADAPILVIHRFEALRAKQRTLLLDFLKMSADNHVLQVILTASSVDPPLDYRERIQTSRYLSSIYLPPLSKGESDEFVSAALARLGCRPHPEVAESIYHAFAGSVEQTLDACALVAATPTLKPLLDQVDRHEDLQERLHTALRGRTRNYLLALLSAIVERGWTIETARRAPHSPPDASRVAGYVPPNAPSIHPLLQSDPVFVSLRNTIADIDLDDVRSTALAPFVRSAATLGKKLLATETQAERVRFLAFAIESLISDPEQPLTAEYRPAYEDEVEEFSFGRVLCDLLLESDLEQLVVVTDDVLDSHFALRELEVVRRSMSKPIIPRYARRLRRLQRDLRIEPPLFAVDPARTSITIWEPRYGEMFGDIRPDLKELVESMDDGLD